MGTTTLTTIVVVVTSGSAQKLRSLNAKQGCVLLEAGCQVGRRVGAWPGELTEACDHAPLDPALSIIIIIHKYLYRITMSVKKLL